MLSLAFCQQGAGAQLCSKGFGTGVLHVAGMGGASSPRQDVSGIQGVQGNGEQRCTEPADWLRCTADPWKAE